MNFIKHKTYILPGISSTVYGTLAIREAKNCCGKFVSLPISHSSPQRKKHNSWGPQVKSTGKGLRQEDSEAVWNELSQYKKRCEEMERNM